MDLNKVFLIGRTGSDPEVRALPSGEPVAKVSLATSKKKGENEFTSWHRLTAFGKTAEIFRDYVRKGSKLHIEGEIRYSEYEKDGSKRYSTEIIVWQMIMLDSKEASSHSPAQRHDEAAPGPGYDDNPIEDEIPF